MVYTAVCSFYLEPWVPHGTEYNLNKSSLHSEKRHLVFFLRSKVHSKEIGLVYVAKECPGPDSLGCLVPLIVSGRC